MKLPKFREFLSSLEVGTYSPETLYNYERDLKVFEQFLVDEIKTPSFYGLN